MTIIFGEQEYPKGVYLEDIPGATGETHYIAIVSRRRGSGGQVQYMGSTNGAAEQQSIDIGPDQQGVIPGVRAAGRRPVTFRGR